MNRAFLLLLILLLDGCATAPLNEPVPTGDATLYVVGRGWHTDIGLPVEEVHGPLVSLERDFPGIRFMVFGFGERQYYMARDAGFGEMLSALLPSKSAILMTALRAPPEQAFAEQQVVVLRVPQNAIDRIALLLWQALEKTADGTVLRLDEGPYPGSLFYASYETYDAFHTCNTWTARLLHEAGIPVDSRGVLFAGQVMQQVAQIAAMQSR